MSFIFEQEELKDDLFVVGGEPGLCLEFGEGLRSLLYANTLGIVQIS